MKKFDEKDERFSIEEWWGELSSPMQFVVIIVSCIVGIFLAILMLFEPLILACRINQMWPLLLYSIPLGIGAGVAIWAEM